jgi:hypothetical protein
MGRRVHGGVIPDRENPPGFFFNPLWLMAFRAQEIAAHLAAEGV